MTRRRILGFAAGGVLLLAVGLIVGRLLAPSVTPTPSTDSAAAGFLRDMQVHHAQAVEMAMLVRDRTDNPDVRQLAYDIAVAQASQSGAMYGLLEAWDLPQFAAQPAMTWTLLPTLDGSGDDHQMDADAPGMPGMATSRADRRAHGSVRGRRRATVPDPDDRPPRGRRRDGRGGARPHRGARRS